MVDVARLGLDFLPLGHFTPADAAQGLHPAARAFSASRSKGALGRHPAAFVPVEEGKKVKSKCTPGEALAEPKKKEITRKSSRRRRGGEETPTAIEKRGYETGKYAASPGELWTPK